MNAMDTADKDERGVGEDSGTTVPLIDIQAGDNKNDETTTTTSKALVSALRNSGFVLVRSPLLTKELQANVIEAASRFLATNTDHDDVEESLSKIVKVIRHPTDPKVYAMLESDDQFDALGSDKSVFEEYIRTLRLIKVDVLRLIAKGLELKDTDFFAKLHNEDNDTVRLITYVPTHSHDTGNRCKEHSDYGTITLLSTDGVSGLELYHNGRWEPVPFVEGTLVVNVGSLLAGWTRGALKATLHRVAGPASLNSGGDRAVLVEATNHPRTSVAFFADPNQHVSDSLAATNNNGLGGPLGDMSVAEYIRWRSGGDGTQRSGVSFTAEESELLEKNQQE